MPARRCRPTIGSGAGVAAVIGSRTRGTGAGAATAGRVTRASERASRMAS